MWLSLLSLSVLPPPFVKLGTSYHPPSIARARSTPPPLYGPTLGWLLCRLPTQLSQMPLTGRNAPHCCTVAPWAGCYAARQCGNARHCGSRACKDRLAGNRLLRHARAYCSRRLMLLDIIVPECRDCGKHEWQCNAYIQLQALIVSGGGCGARCGTATTKVTRTSSWQFRGLSHNLSS